ncbi:GNAT family protein [Bacillus sp. 31A1R]|uniref:GNAT family protein n=1 Tax=Robertmurraya mangrovi TaxID=3098077 RepID=A0ABU5IYW2_9BACI|nr:GNAT family protein [Bacillus sp. 31A1R]MDZ5472344.1 GNAT family protein [Bacillus sp. 31A1R]
MQNLETERLLLRTLRLEDSERVEVLASDYDVAKSTLTIPHPYPEGSARDFITSILEAEKSGRISIFAIEEKESGQLIGIINVSIAESYKRGELAYWIGKPYWGKGYGTEATKALISYSFNQLKLNKVFACAFTDNPGSWKIMEKVGLKYEGTLKQHVSRDGVFYDLCYYGLLKDEYSQ